MKRLLSILLVVAMVATLALTALPAMAEENDLDIVLSTTDITATTAISSVCAEEVYDEETGELIFRGPEYTYYDWGSTCSFDATINGNAYEGLSAGGLANVLGYGPYTVACYDTQYVNHWEVGGSYPVTIEISEISDSYDESVVQSFNLTVTLCERSVDIDLSDIEVDELYGQTEEGGQYRYYDWKRFGTMTVTIDGAEHKNMTLDTLRELLKEKYGEVFIDCHLLSDIGESAENQWEVGDEFEFMVDIKSSWTGAILCRDTLFVRLCETKINSFSISPVTYYPYQGWVCPEITINYKDGTSAISDKLECFPEESWPDKPGTYTVNFTVLGAYTVPVQVTVLANPTSGKLGEDITWNYDDITQTLTLSGSGGTFYCEEDYF